MTEDEVTASRRTAILIALAIVAVIAGLIIYFALTRPPLLSAQTHTDGWQQVACWDKGCHVVDETHSLPVGGDPYLCVTCHGDNGARDVSADNHPDRPQACTGECHESHGVAASFPDPESCVTCHDAAYEVEF